MIPSLPAAIPGAVPADLRSSVITWIIHGHGSPETPVLHRLFWPLRVELGDFFPSSSLLVSPTSWLGPRDTPPSHWRTSVLVTVLYRGPGGSSVFLPSFGSPSPKVLCHPALRFTQGHMSWNMALCGHCLTGVSTLHLFQLSRPCVKVEMGAGGAGTRADPPPRPHSLLPMTSPCLVFGETRKERLLLDLEKAFQG